MNNDDPNKCVKSKVKTSYGSGTMATQNNL